MRKNSLTLVVILQCRQKPLAFIILISTIFGLGGWGCQNSSESDTAGSNVAKPIAPKFQLPENAKSIDYDCKSTYTKPGRTKILRPTVWTYRARGLNNKKDEIYLNVSSDAGVLIEQRLTKFDENGWKNEKFLLILAQNPKSPQKFMTIVDNWDSENETVINGDRSICKFRCIAPTTLFGGICVATGETEHDPIAQAIIDSVLGWLAGPIVGGAKTLMSGVGSVAKAEITAASRMTNFGGKARDLTVNVLLSEEYAKTRKLLAQLDATALEDAAYLKQSLAGIDALDEVEVAAINYHRKGGSSAMNLALQGQKPDWLMKLEPVIVALSSGLKKLESRAFKGAVYKVINVRDDSVLAVYSPGDTIVERAFTSTSKESFKLSALGIGGNVKFVINSINGKLIKEFSDFETEEEVLFPPGTLFKVVSKTKEAGVTVIKMDQVP